MIIVSQDKRKIINFENICRVEMNRWGEGNNITIDAFSNDNFEIQIGGYSTEERAKEVLRDLLKRMNSQKFLLKPKVNLKDETIKSAKEYFEKINGIDLIIDDNNFEIIPINKDNTTIYEMPKE